MEKTTANTLAFFKLLSSMPYHFDWNGKICKNVDPWAISDGRPRGKVKGEGVSLSGRGLDQWRLKGLVIGRTPQMKS